MLKPLVDIGGPCLKCGDHLVDVIRRLRLLFSLHFLNRTQEMSPAALAEVCRRSAAILYHADYADLFWVTTPLAVNRLRRLTNNPLSEAADDAFGRDRVPIRQLILPMRSTRPWRRLKRIHRDGHDYLQPFLDVRVVTDEDFDRKTSLAAKIGAATDAARLLPLAEPARNQQSAALDPR